jgi:hypothetical protein
MRKCAASCCARVHALLLPSFLSTSTTTATSRLAMSPSAATTAALGRPAAPGAARAYATSRLPRPAVLLPRRVRPYAALPAAAHPPRAGQAVRAAAVRFFFFFAWREGERGGKSVPDGGLRLFPARAGLAMACPACLPCIRWWKAPVVGAARLEIRVAAEQQACRARAHGRPSASSSTPTRPPAHGGARGPPSRPRAMACVDGCAGRGGRRARARGRRGQGASLKENESGAPRAWGQRPEQARAAGGPCPFSLARHQPLTPPSPPSPTPSLHPPTGRRRPRPPARLARRHVLHRAGRGRRHPPGRAGSGRRAGPALCGRLVGRRRRGGRGRRRRRPRRRPPPPGPPVHARLHFRVGRRRHRRRPGRHARRGPGPDQLRPAGGNDCGAASAGCDRALPHSKARL